MEPKDPAWKLKRSPEKSAPSYKKFKISDPDSPTCKTGGNKLKEVKGQNQIVLTKGARARQELFTNTNNIMENLRPPIYSLWERPKIKNLNLIFAMVKMHSR